MTAVAAPARPGSRRKRDVFPASVLGDVIQRQVQRAATAATVSNDGVGRLPVSILRSVSSEILTVAR